LHRASVEVECQTPSVVSVDDIETQFATARAHGASIIEPIKHHGFKAYVIEDLEGRRWTFAHARPTMR
jgi:uncharacterized glyoxalase superfamily protein PhnB